MPEPINMDRVKIVWLNLALLFLAYLIASTQADAKGYVPYLKNLDHHLPAKWGAYQVMEQGSFAYRIEIRDRHHKIAREIDCGDHSAIYVQQIDKTGIPDLVVVAWSGSNLYCTHTTYIFSQDHGLRNVAIIVGGEGKFQSLDDHGLEFVMQYSGVLEFACDVCHACEPNLPVILQWRNSRTTDATAHYPTMSRATAASYRRDFVDIRVKWNASNSGDEIIAPAAGYYANEYELQHGQSAYRWVMRRLPTKETRQWFRYCAKVVRYQISQIQHMTTVSQDHVLTASRSNVFTNPPDYPKMNTLLTPIQK